MAKKKKVSKAKKSKPKKSRSARIVPKKKARAPRARHPQRHPGKPPEDVTTMLKASATSFAPAFPPVPDKVEKRALVFTLAEGSASRVRITLDGDEVVLANGVSTPSKPRANGEEVPVLIEVMGNEGDKGIVNATNSKPGKMTTPPIAAGSTGIRDPRLIEVKFT